MLKDPEAVFAVGYSTHALGEFIGILQAHSVTMLVDIRTIPRSRHMPEYNKEHLKEALAKKGIGYLHMKDLGGLRKPNKDSINRGWRNASFRGFADYMQTKEFGRALKILIAFGSKNSVAIMCAEGNPFRCHRSLIADALLVRHIKVLHIVSKGSAREHRLTPFAKIEGLRITYP